ncbi:unnamed protein product [Bursaphelenchus xylophilus]|uniref:(pine wood nematode) hypothetical protein n=1 Tax=Bursaphelenchus xylophilus TaxID=6326 RepID=A0A1I7SLQ8_BURXY|nr:unnamed protein product [Bursaphelenchus xylophilus]CAG9129705.1 unnamed protein product [Bursaphelenchus xylophilus]
MEKTKKEYWTILVIVLTYILAVYCCLVELLLDLFCDSSASEKFRRWKEKTHSSGAEGSSQKYALITGADGTIGVYVTEYLVSLGYEVIVLGLRKPTIPSLKDNSQLCFIQCDLLHDESLNKAIAVLQSKNLSKIDLVAFVAGTMLHAPLDTKDSIDPHYAINLLAHAKIMEKARSLLEKSESPGAVFVSSSTSRLGDVSDIVVDNDHAFRDYINGYKSYADSKLAVNLYCKAFSRELQNENSKVKLISVHPGVVPGGLYRSVFPPIKMFINKFLPFILRTPQRAAAEILEAIYNDKFNSGDYVEYNRSAGFMNYSDSQLASLMKNIRREIG